MEGHRYARSAVKILVVDDAEKLARFLARALGEEGYRVELCADGNDAIELASTSTYDLVILDWMLPGIDGPTVCRELRRKGVATPIIMLTARVEPSERVLGLDAGADDFLTKPFDVEELLARVRAQLRRSQGMPQVCFGELRLDPLEHRAFLEDRPLDLTPREYALLMHLVSNAGRIVRRTELLSAIWGTHHDPSSKIVEVQISRLRDKLGRHGAWIETVRGMGYRMRLD
jgi:two-component system, OmpR family, response regulator